MARPWCWCWVWCRRRWSAPVGLQPGMPRGQRFVAEHCLLLCWAAACATRQRTVRHGCLLRHCATALLRYCATACRNSFFMQARSACPPVATAARALAIGGGGAPAHGGGRLVVQWSAPAL